MLKLADKTGNVRAIASSASGRVNSLAHLYTRARPPHRAAPAAAELEVRVVANSQPARQPHGPVSGLGALPDFSCAIAGWAGAERRGEFLFCESAAGNGRWAAAALRLA
jgi:hypothetical protein